MAHAGATQQISGPPASGVVRPVPPGGLTDDFVVFGAGGNNIKIEALKGDDSAPGVQTLFANTDIALEISAGAGTGAGANLTVSGGAGAAGNNGGAAALQGGAGDGVGSGGAASVTGGAAGATGDGGTASVRGAAGGATSGDGGASTLGGGDATTDGNGGSTSIVSGAGVGTNRSGGPITVQPGSSTGTADGPAINLRTGVSAGTGQRGLLNHVGSCTFNTNEVTLNSNQDDYTGANGYGVLKINATGNFDLTGLANPVSGRQVLLYNTGASTITLKHDVTSAAANRFYLPGAADLAIGQYRGVLLEYAPTVARWIVVGMSAASGTAGLANVAYVSKAGDDATAELNNEAKPYLTIAAAITAAAADIALGAGPYTIQLGTGTWTENLTWAEQLSLRGLGNRVSIVSGTLTLTAGATAVANELNFSDVRITGDVALNFNAKTAGTSAVYCNACYFGDSFSMNKRSGGTDELRMDASTVVDRLTSTEVAAVRLFDSAIDDLRIAQSGGSERSTVVGCCGSILVLSGSAGTVSMTACQYRDGSLSIAVAALETSGCDFKGSSVTITAGTWIQNGCTFSNSGYLASAAPGTVDLTYWGGVVNVTAAATLTLPATASKGYFLTVKNGNSVASGNNVTIARNGNSIEGSAADYVIGPLSSVTLMGDGTNWWIIS